MNNGKIYTADEQSLDIVGAAVALKQECRAKGVTLTFEQALETVKVRELSRIENDLSKIAQRMQ